MKKLDVLLIHPGNREETYQGLASEFAALEPPLWAGLMASFLRQKGLEVRIFDTNLEQLGHKDAADAIKQFDPALVAIVCYGHQPSASTLVMPGAGALARQLKDQAPDLPIIFVGGHVAALPERTLKEEACDFVCDGEGPYTLHDLALALRAVGSKWRTADFSKVRGLLYEQDGEIQHNISAPLITDLNHEMPGVAWDLLEPERYTAHNWLCFGRLDERKGYAAIYSSLGCPFFCDFCCIQAPFRSGERISGKAHSYRHWASETVLNQFDELVNKHHIKNYRIADELFLMNNAFVRGILDGLIERNYGLNIFAYTRLDTYNDELLELAQKAGISWLSLTIESASEDVLRSVGKGTHSDMAVKAKQDFKRAGINAVANVVFGLPGDSEATMQQTLDMLIDLNCEFVNLYSAMAYPGSKLYDQAIREGWKLPATWNGYAQHGYETLPLDTRYLSGREVLAFRDLAFHKYFASERYLNMMEEKFGRATREHLERMTAYRLPRKFLTDDSPE